MLAPELIQGFARRAANKDIGVVFALLIGEAKRVSIVTGQAAACEYRIGLFAREAENDERCRRRRGIAAVPFRVGGPDGLGQAIRAAQYLDCAILAVVSGCDSEVYPLVGGQRIAN